MLHLYYTIIKYTKTIYTMSTIEMPKTYKEELEELGVGESIAIEKDKRQTWSNAIYTAQGKTNKQFCIRTIRATGEIRVWRLADAE